MNFTGVLLFFSSLLLLSSCSHKNSLDMNTPNQSGKFLYQASLFAEKNLNNGQDHGGLDYANCAEGNLEYIAPYCQNLYKKILVFSREAQNKSYANLTIDDLTEANTYFRVRSFYYNQVYLHSKNY